MEINVRRTGGFAGVNEALGPVDTAELQEELGDRVQEKVEEIAFFDLPAELPEERLIEDGFVYEITVVEGERRRVVSYSDGTEERYREPLNELVELLAEGGATFERRDR